MGNPRVAPAVSVVAGGPGTRPTKKDAISRRRADPSEAPPRQRHPDQPTRRNRSHPTAPLPPSHLRAKVNHMVQYSTRLDTAFGALSDPTRRGILERLGRGDASISDLAERFEMTLTGIKKHVAVLEEAGLVTTEKVGRVRTCRLGPRRLDDETEWIAAYQRMLDERLDRLGYFLEHNQGALP